jgi:hypothetical protein
MHMSIALEFQAEQNISGLIREAAKLNRGDLLELRDAILGLLDAQVIDLDSERLERKSATQQQAQGWYELSYKSKNGKKHGPYKYFRYRTGGKKKSTYLGKVSPVKEQA